MFILPLGPVEDDLFEDGQVRRPWFTYGLLVLLALAFLVGAGSVEGSDYVRHVMNWGFLADLGISSGLVTHMFVHGSFWHLLANSIFLLVFGSAVELKLGRIPSVVIFLVGIWYHFRVYPIDAWIVCVLYVAREVLNHQIQGILGGTAYMAHVGGAVGGVLVGLVLIPQFSKIVTTSTLPTIRKSPSLSMPRQPARPRSSTAPATSEPLVTEQVTEKGPFDGREDLSNLSGTWAPNWRNAELKHKLDYARRLEKSPLHAQRILNYYDRMLHDTKLSPGYRTYAGLRMCIMLHRAGNHRTCLRLAKRLLANRLPADFSEAIQGVAKLSAKALNPAD